MRLRIRLTLPIIILFGICTEAPAQMASGAETPLPGSLPAGSLASLPRGLGRLLPPGQTRGRREGGPDLSRVHPTPSKNDSCYLLAPSLRRT